MNQTIGSEATTSEASARGDAIAERGRVERFTDYALAFERVLIDDEWRRLEPFFTADAVRQVVCGGPLAAHSIGRDAVIADLRRGVEALERRFDRRLPEIVSGPTERDGVVWMDWRLTLQCDGLPDLVIDGTHGAYYDGGRISRLEEAVFNQATERIEAYFARHGDRLKPARPAEPKPAGLTRDRMGQLVRGYAEAKSCADVDAALSFCHDRFRLETVSFGVTSHDKTETALHLRAFFEAFPDYQVTLGGMTFGDGAVACWGSARMSLLGSSFGLPPTGQRAELPFFCAFTFADGLLASERFFFDLAALCDGVGVPLADMQAALAPFRDVAPSKP